jgi:hypothetical protein
MPKIVSTSTVLEGVPLVSIHGWRPGQCGLLRTPARRVFRRMGNRACGGARSLPRCFVSAVRQAKVPPCLRRSACPPQGFWRWGFAQAGTGFLRRPHWPVRLSRASRLDASPCLPAVGRQARKRADAVIISTFPGSPCRACPVLTGWVESFIFSSLSEWLLSLLTKCLTLQQKNIK